MYTVADDIDGLIFDFDGTIVDSMPVHYLSWKAAFDHFGSAFSEQFFYAHAGVSLLGVVEKFNGAHGTELNPADVVARKDAAHMAYLPQTRVIPQVFEVVQRYHGTLPLAVATGNSRNLTLPLMEMLDLSRYFEGVVYGDDVVHSKPHPECFLTAASLLGVPPQKCEVFEDGEPGILGALAAGMKVTDIRKWL